MTLHRAEQEVGVRELHDHLSRYLRRVAEGREIVVTMRGRRVARLSPLEGQSPLARLRERGLVQEPARPRGTGGLSKPVRATESVADLVAEQRR
jgi:prevent-host-death family protein